MELVVLRLIHIIGGTFWVGSGLFTTFFLMPALGRAGPATAAPVMAALQQRRLFTILPVVALLTILSGVRLFQLVSDGFSAAYLSSRPGQTYLWSGLAAIAAFLLSLLVARPAAVRIGQLGAMASLPEDQRAARAVELERLRNRSGVASTIAMILLIGAAAGMAVARYLG